MKALAQRTKAELVYLATHRCPHRHLLIEHPQCIPKDAQRIGHLDIETSELEADRGFMLTWCIKVDGEDTLLSDVITAADIAKATKGDEDKRIVASLIEALKGFDRIITYYGSGFDVPFIRTRALICGLEFLPFGSLHHTDLYFVAKFKLKLARRSLENVCRNILGTTDKTHFDMQLWRRAARGHKPALAQVLDHNQKDCTDLEKAYHVLLPYTRETKRSI